MKCGLFFVCFTLYLGRISAALVPRIIGGVDTTIEQSPYQASLRVRGVHFCGGCIISEKHILTAAHCVTHIKEFVPPFKDVRVTTGTSSSKEIGQSHSIASFVVHPEWTDSKKSSYVNDIAVITLAVEMTFNRYQQKIEFTDREVLSRETGVLTGWGRTAATRSRPKSRMSVQLQKLRMYTLNSTDCQEHLVYKVHKNQFCVYHSVGHGSCAGDSGSPLVINNRLSGILSWICGADCADGTGEIFSSVYAHKNFIESAMT